MVSLTDQLLPEEVDVLSRTAGSVLDVSAMLVVQDVFRAAAALRSRLESGVLHAEGMTWASFTMLFCLWTWGAAETRDLALRMGVSRPTVSGVTDTLERRGLVERRTHEADARLRTVALTAAGERTFEELFPRIPEYTVTGPNVRILTPTDRAFEHLPVDSPYRSSHAIYVRAGATSKYDGVDAVPPALARRLLSVRAFDADGLMVSGEIVEGANLAPYIEEQLANPVVAYLHAHYARRGCFAARIDRVGG